MVNGNKMKHEIEVGFPRGVAFLQPVSQHRPLSVKHRDRLHCMEVAAARIAAAFAGQLARRAGSGGHRRLGPRRFVLEVFDLTPAAKHDLEATISLADVVQPRGERDVIGEPIPKSTARRVLSCKRLDIAGMLGQRDGSPGAERVVTIRRQLDAIF